MEVVTDIPEDALYSATREDYELSNARAWLPTTEADDARNDRLPSQLRGSKTANPRSLKRFDHQVSNTAYWTRIQMSNYAEKHGLAPPRPRPLDPNHIELLPIIIDSEAKTSWKKRDPHTGTLRLPDIYANIVEFLAPPMFPTHGSDQRPSPYLILDEVMEATGVFIESPQRNSIKLAFWGTKSQVKAAKSQLQEWLNLYQANRPKNGDPWGKFLTLSTSDRTKTLGVKDDYENGAKEKFRRVPDQNEHFPHQGFFLWPSSDFRPDVILGRNFEALDTIRSTNRCYITFNPNNSTFAIMSQAASCIQGALRGIRVTLCEITTRSARQTRLYLVEPSPFHLAREEVELFAVQPSNASSNRQQPAIPTVTPGFVGEKMPEANQKAWENLCESIFKGNEECLTNAVTATLKHIRYFRGHVRMRVRFGRLLLNSYKKAEDSRMSTENFINMMRHNLTEGHLDNRLGDASFGPVLLSSCYASRSFLQSPGHTSEGLEAVKPLYGATFEVFTRNGSVGRLEVEFSNVDLTESSLAGCEVCATRWVKGDNYAQSQIGSSIRQLSKPLDAIVTNLHSKSSYQFEIVADDTIESSKFSSNIATWTSTIRLQFLKSRTPEKRTEVVFDMKTPAITVHRYTERKSYQYILRDTTYQLEISEHRSFEKLPGNVIAPKYALVGTAWGATLTDLEWDSHLSEQPSLNIGQEGSWSDKLSAFFPAHVRQKPGQSNSFWYFLQKVREVLDFLNKTKLAT
ncbi:MAG: hypothetical protein M1829_000706 [Trizodia sp. TS-e1964]|nr:MAG: hypothetical protein M1829_000706 [Trizodia sp. TS-e1964]